MAEIKAYITLIGADYDINYVTELIGIQPDNIRRCDEILGNGKRFGHTEWGIETQTEVGDDVEAVLKQLIHRAKSKIGMMQKAAENCCATWDVLIMIKVYDDMPLILFSTETIKFLYEIQAKVGFDTYLLLDNAGA